MAYQNHQLVLLRGYLSSRKQCVKEGEYSEFKKIVKGVQQGSILGPVLFNIFINNIFYFVDKSCITMQMIIPCLMLATLLIIWSKRQPLYQIGFRKIK